MVVGRQIHSDVDLSRGILLLMGLKDFGSYPLVHHVLNLIEGELSRGLAFIYQVVLRALLSHLITEVFGSSDVMARAFLTASYER